MPKDNATLTEQVSVRFKPDELQNVELEAEKDNRNRASFIRHATMKEVCRRKEERERGQ